MLNLKFSANIQFGIRQKIILILLIILLFTLSISGWLMLKRVEASALDEINLRGNDLSRIVARALTSSVVSYDYHSVEQLLKEVTSSDEISYAKVLSRKGNVMAESGIINDSTNIEVSFTQDIMLDNRSVGKLFLGITTDKIINRLGVQKIALLKQEIVIILFIALVEFLALSYIIIRPLNIISKSLDKNIDETGSIAGNIPLTSNDEFGQLALLFNHLSSQLYTANNKLKQKVDISHQELVKTNQQLVKKSEELRKISEEFKKLSITDSLTGLYNRRHFEELMLNELELSRRHNYVNSLLIIDIDHFKKINDNYGHPGGDEALKAVAQSFISQMRQSDIICRIGDEEFAVLCKRANKDDTLLISEHLRKSIAETAFTIDNHEVFITVSIGIETITDSLKDLTPLELSELIYQHADKAVYYSKQNGRNRLTHYHDINHLVNT